MKLQKSCPHFRIGDYGLALRALTLLLAMTALWTTSAATVIAQAGTVRAWGGNWLGQLGDGTTITRTTPVQVGGLTGGLAVAAGSQHSVVLKADGTVWSWGYNGDGQLGDGTSEERHTPVQTSSLTNATAAVAGYGHTLAIIGALPTHTLIVINGSGGGFYGQGAQVEITADVPPGHSFDQWVGDVGTVADIYSPATTIIVDGDHTVTARLGTLLQVAVEIEDDLDWVYQNTPGSLANGGHKVRLTVNVLDYGENDSVEVAVAKVPGSGPGEVTIEDDPGDDPLVKYIFGSLRTDGTADCGPLTLQVVASGNVSQVVAVEVPFTVRRLGDIDGNGAPEPGDVMTLIMKLNGNPPAGYHDKAFDLDANGAAEPGDVQILMNLLNGQPIP